MATDQYKEDLFTYAPASDVLDSTNLRLLAELGRRIGMSAPAVTERVRRLEDTGAIQGYRLDVNPSALGLPITVYVRVRPDPGQLPRIAETARRIPEVVECHRITGEDCFILKAHIPAMDQLDQLLDRLLLYGATTTSIVQSSPVLPRPLPLPS